MFAVRFNFITRSDLTEAVEKIAPEYRRHLQDLYYIKITRPRRSLVR
ncbi:hypothetical protein AKMV027 [Akhmeta virus]|uniref:Kelch-like protein n=1 Tax=Orthopoxvirus akhmetapox TaxID=2200830 RepID=A0A346FRY9_9POXV|nr:hypothetical protein KM542_gp027 [Akhmeta virus]AXN74812.1 hypothetical protein AKMV-88-027 [Akhmeta virus]AXN75032.1 hypothetical protein AKMV027 [Akhmeta virus]QEQ49364.1 Kelch-like protein [Akhmeta virus]